MGEQVEPARMYEIRAELDASGIYLTEEIERFCQVYFKPKARQSPSDHREMNAALDPPVDRFRNLLEKDEDAAELWRGKVAAFRNLYSFLSQIIPYQDSDLERLYTFLRHLASKLPRRHSGPHYSFDDEIRLEYYRLQKISEGSISLREARAAPLDGPSEVGSGMVRERPVPLSKLIDVINERFGTEFTDADQLFFDQIAQAAMEDETLKQAAQANPEDKFALVFNRVLETLFVDRMEQNEDIFARFMNDESFQRLVGSWLVSDVYKRLRGTGVSYLDGGASAAADD
jgi:type I restriction enzyme, R subunit